MIRWTWLVRNFEYPFEWTRRQKSVVFEVERAQKTFSRDFVGARSILDLDNYVEREKERREREKGKRQWQRGSGKWQTDTKIITTHPGISSLRITPRRNTGKEVTWKFIGKGLDLFVLSYETESSATRKETSNDFLILKRLKGC